MTAVSYTFDSLFQPKGPGLFVYDFIPYHDRPSLASSCKSCLHTFTQHLLTFPKESQAHHKSFALRHFLLANWQPEYSIEGGLFPLMFLNELKKINATLINPASNEFVGKFRKAYYEADIETLKIMISFGVDASQFLMNDILKMDQRQFSPPHDINPKVLKVVLSSPRIALNANYFRGTYPLVLAAIFLDQFEIWEALDGNEEINWNYTDKKGRNLAFWSTCCHSPNRLRFLKMCKDKNVEMDKKDHNGNRASSVAVQHHKVWAFKFLVNECDVDLNAQNDSGVTVVHEICERSHVDLLEFVISKGVRWDIKNKNGETAVDYARMYYSSEIADVLKQHNLWDNKQND